MPAFGFNPYADQTESIKSLGASLFPDPSKAALAYHYGTESRKGQLESNKLIDQQNWRNDYGMMSQGLQPAPPTWQQPTNVPGAAPIRAPNAYLPMAGAAPPAVPPAAAANLAQIVTNSTPAQGADLLKQAIPAFTSGQAAGLTGPPAPGLPAAPQTTGSDGSVPNDIGVLQPGSIDDTGGGMKGAGPASHHGSPSRVPPGMTLPGLMAMAGAGSLAGLDAASVQAGGSALAYELYSRGMIGRDQYHQMLGATNAPQMAVADTQAAAAVTGHQLSANAAITGHRLSAAATMEAARLREAEQARQFNYTSKPSVDAEGNVIYTPQKDLPGKKYYEPTVAAAVAGQKARDAGEVGNYMDPNNPGKVIQALKPDAIARGLHPAPTTLEGAQAPISTAIFGAPTLDAAAPLIERRDRALPPPKATAGEKAKEDEAQQALLDQTLQRRIARAPEGWIMGADLPAAPSGDLSAVLGKLTNDYYNSGPKGIKGEHIAAANAAIQQGIDEGWINPAQPKSTQIAKDVKEGNNIVTRPHTQIDLWDKPGNKPRSAAGFYPAMRGALAATAVPAATPAPAGAKPIGRAPPGTPDGPQMIGGKPHMVRGGLVYAE